MKTWLALWVVPSSPHCLSLAGRAQSLLRPYSHYLMLQISSRSETPPPKPSPLWLPYHRALSSPLPTQSPWDPARRTRSACFKHFHSQTLLFPFQWEGTTWTLGLWSSEGDSLASFEHSVEIADRKAQDHCLSNWDPQLPLHSAPQLPALLGDPQPPQVPVPRRVSWNCPSPHRGPALACRSALPLSCCPASGSLSS